MIINIIIEENKKYNMINKNQNVNINKNIKL